MRTKRVVLAFLVAGTSVSAAPAGELVIDPGADAIFKLATVGQRLVPITVRRAPIGPADPADPASGEISVGLAPPGGAVRAARLHVYERSRKAVTFTATPIVGPKAVASTTVCGHLGTDSWTTLPPETLHVVLSNFAETDKSCD